MILDKMLFLFTKTVMGILDLARVTENAFDFAVKYTLAFAKLMSAWLPWNGAREDSEPDSDTFAIDAAATASAEGLAPEVATGLSVEVVDHPLVTIGYGTTRSYAAAEGEGADIATGHHLSITGADLAFTQKVSHAGANYEASMQTMFAVDFKQLADLELSFERETAFTCRGKNLPVKDGTVAIARSDVIGQGENTMAEAFADTWIEHDTFAHAFSEGSAAIA